ncbi:MAG: hypothetical protein ABSE79_23140 [Terriglobia bacterium]
MSLPGYVGRVYLAKWARKQAAEEVPRPVILSGAKECHAISRRDALLGAEMSSFYGRYFSYPLYLQ